MPLILQGATSGQATLQATDAQTVTITMPATSGTLVTTGGAQTIEFADGSASAPSITNSGDTNTGIFFPAADTIAFTEGGAESMRIDSSGNVGIGTSSPQTRLQSVASGTGLFEVARLGNTQSRGAGVGVKLGFQPNNDFVSNGLIGASVSAVNTSGGSGNDISLVFGTGSGGSESERMRITSAGLVGIGTNSPSATLDVRREVSGQAFQIIKPTVSTGGANIYMQSDSANSGTAVQFNWGAEAYGSGFVGGGSANAYPFTFYTNGSERMRINSSGDVLFGKTTTASTTAGSYFSQSDAFALNISQAIGNRAVIFSNTGGTGVGNITINASTTSYNTSSDYRLKENIAPMTGALDKVAALKPVTYDWKAGGSSQGFIAHELQAIVPDCVTGEKDGMRTEQYEVSPAIEATYDEEGNELTPAVEAVMGEREVPDYQGIDTSFLVATLTAAIQEQQAIITDLKARIETLENT